MSPHKTAGASGGHRQQAVIAAETRIDPGDALQADPGGDPARLRFGSLADLVVHRHAHFNQAQPHILGRPAEPFVQVPVQHEKAPQHQEEHRQEAQHERPHHQTRLDAGSLAALLPLDV